MSTFTIMSFNLSVKKEDEIVYDEVKTRDKTTEQTGDTNGKFVENKQICTPHSAVITCCYASQAVRI